MKHSNQSKEYREYIGSLAWHARSRRALELAKFQCQRCDAVTGLQVHHLTYERLGAERDSDLLVVCKKCHEKEDEKRKNSAAAIRWAARVEGWAAKRWGEDWEEIYSFDYVEERFQEWLALRDE